MTHGDRRPTDVRSALQPSGAGRTRGALPAESGSAHPQTSNGSDGLDLSGVGNAAFLWAGVAGLLAAAVVSVGLFGSPGSPDKAKTQQTGVNAASLMQPVAAGESAAAIARLMMSGSEKERVRAELADGKLRLAVITVSDNFEEDGDWVRISAAGFQQDVRLLHNSYTVTVPYLPGMPVSVSGLVDGRGGDITVSVYVGAARLSLKPLKTGEVLQIRAP